MKKFLTLCLALVMVFGLTAAAHADAPESVSITWGDWMLSEDAFKDIYGAMVTNFMADNVGVNVETYVQPYSSYLDQLLIASAAGNGPDVAHIKAEWLPQFLALGVVKDIYPCVSEEVLNDYSESARNAAMVDGKMVGMPWFCNAYAMFYNKDLLEQAGITELPKTMDELFEAAEKISALGTDTNGNKIYGLALPAAPEEAGCGYNALPILWAYGAEYQDTDGKISIASENGMKAFEKIQKLYTGDMSPKGASFKDTRNLFGQGVIGFYWDAEAALSSCKAAAPDADAFTARTGAMVIPAADSANGYGYLSERYMIVFNSCPDEKMDAMASFLEYMSGSKAINVLYEANQGKMSSRTSVMNEVYGDVNSDITAAFVSAMGTARSLPSGNLAFMDADEQIANALVRLGNGEDLNTVVIETQENIQALYDEQ